MKQIVYKSFVIILFVCAAVCVQAQTVSDDSVFAQQWSEYAQINPAMKLDALWKLDTIGRLATQTGDELQRFHVNYERIKLTYSPEEPDAIWFADSLVTVSPQPYKAVYNFLISQMLARRRSSLGMKSDASNIRDLMKWSEDETYANAVRYSDSAFTQLFEYGLVPATDFAFMTLPGNVLQLPEMTLADMILLSALQYPLTWWKTNYATDNALDKAIQFHQTKGDKRILLEYEICKLFHYPFDGGKSPDESPIWQGLVDLEKKYGQQTAIDYEKGQLLYYYLINTPPSSEELQRKYSLLCKSCFDKVLASATDTFYRKNARLRLEEITRPELFLLEMPENLPPAPKVLLPINYRNIDTLYVSAYRIPQDDPYFYASTRSKIDQYFQKGTLREPVIRQRFVLPNPVPYFVCHTDLFLDSLPKGNYLLLYHTSAQYDTNNILVSNELNITTIKIEEIIQVKRHYLTFMDAVTGEPLSELKVTKENIAGMRFSRKTDRNGLLRVRHYETSWRWDHFVNDGPDCVVPYFIFDSEDDEDDDEKPDLRPERWYFHYGNEIESRIILDRPIYRPEQTVYFKAYIVNGHKMAANCPVVAVLSDKEHREISRIELTTNKFGTIAGHFDLPDNMFQSGNIRIYCKGKLSNLYIWKSFDIAAYRLPSFKVVFEHVVEPLVIGDSVRFTGRAVSFTGDPIRNANITISLEDRQSKFGIPTTYHLQSDENGDFRFSYQTYDTNVYSYYINANVSVTDVNGETQQARHGFYLDHKPFRIKALFTSIDLARTDTLRGTVSVTEHYFGEKPIPIPVKIEVFRLEEPDPSKPLIYQNYKKPSHPLYSEEDYHRYFPNYSFIDLQWKRNLWPVGERIFSTERLFMEDETMNIPAHNWQLGTYRIQLTAVDSLGRCDTTLAFVRLINSADTLPIANSALDVRFLERNTRSVKLIISSSLDNVPVYCFVTQGKRIISKQLLHLNKNSRKLTFGIRKSPHTVNVLCFTSRNNKKFSSGDRILDESYYQKYFQPGTLSLNMIHWNSTLYPGAEERWELEVLPTKGKLRKEQAEVLAWMVDSSLYRLPRTHEFKDWIMPYEGSYRASTRAIYFYSIDSYDLSDDRSWARVFENKSSFSTLYKCYSVLDLEKWPTPFPLMSPHYSGGFVPDHTSSSRLSGENIRTTPGRSVSEKDDPFENVRTELDGVGASTSDWESAPFRIRRDFRETAFFLPQLQTNDSGRVAFTFTVPDQLTTWQFYAQAHTKDLSTGHLSGSIVAKLPIMLQSNAPRFLRDGDTLDLRAKITNRSDKDLDGTVTLEFFDTVGNQPVNMVFNPDCRDAAHRVSTEGTSQFHVPAGASQEVHFRVIVPENIPAVSYRMVARSGNFGDGEERTLLVLPKRMLLTEAYPFFVPENTDTTLTFSRFLTNAYPTLSHERFTVEVTTNPAWLAIHTLPALLHPNYESNDNLFATAFAAATLKQVKRQNSEPLPDENLNRILQKSLNKLKSNQLPDGGWDWYGSNNFSQMVTCEVVSGFYKLQRMGVELPAAQKMLAKAVARADSAQAKRYQDYLKERQQNPKAEFSLFNEEDVQYLYMRSFIQDNSDWLSESYVQNLMAFAVKDIYKENYTRQAEVALILHRTGRTEEARQIMESLRQQAVRSVDQGMYWRRKWTSRYYPWYEAPIEQQSLIIEAFSEISPREEELKAMKQWLLLQKKGQQWQSTRATMSAVYALLLDEPKTMLDNATTTVTVGGETFSSAGTADKKGTGYLQHTWEQDAVTPALGNVTVRTDREHPAIGACYWQYWTTTDSVESVGSGLTVIRSYYHQPTTAGGYAAPVTADNPAHLGERITVRVTVISDRWLDFVRVSDPRPAAFEPVNVREQYRQQQDVGWVESPRDESTEFFFQHIPQGTVLIEYDVFATQTGDFSTGAPTVECTYAPEWRAQSPGTRVNVR